MVQSRTIISAIFISIIVLVVITEVVTSLLPNDTSTKNNVKKKHQIETHSDVEFRKLQAIDDYFYFWSTIATGILIIICVILTCYCWCTVCSSGRRVRIIIATYWNRFSHRLSQFRGHRGEYYPTRQQQEMQEVNAPYS